METAALDLIRKYALLGLSPQEIREKLAVDAAILQFEVPGLPVIKAAVKRVSSPETKQRLQSTLDVLWDQYRQTQAEMIGLDSAIASIRARMVNESIGEKEKATLGQRFFGLSKVASEQRKTLAETLVKLTDAISKMSALAGIVPAGEEPGSLPDGSGSPAVSIVFEEVRRED